MRVVVVNHCHPEMPHVCAVRAREFAGALSRRGHRVVLLTGTLRPDDPAEDPAAFGERLRRHDWAEPLRLACRPQGHPILRRMREGRLPALVSKLAVAGYYVFAGSVFPDWGRGVRPYLDALAAGFSPEIVWTNFGNTECLAIAQDLSRRSGCPWVVDVKDYWSTFIPAPFRGRLGRRYDDAAAMTALSRGHLDDIAPWMPGGAGGATVVHSGIPDALAGGAPAQVDRNRVLIVGAIYDRGHLAALIDGIARWSDGSAVVEYAGDEGALVAAEIARQDGIADFVDHGYMALTDLHRAQCRVLANAFVRSGPGWFQHKVPELIAARRPILSLPASDQETTALAERARVPFFNCGGASDATAALAEIARASQVDPDIDFIDGLTWDRQAESLERALQSAIR